MWEYFTLDEFDCSETGENEIDEDFVTDLDELRRRCGFAFVVNSGYRSKLHSAEMKKEKPGYHTKGIAADIAVHTSYRRYIILQHALEMDFRGIGHGKDFVHLDKRSTPPKSWTY
jgi:uncharacterized protein YcbK (DUF882 family)